MPAQIAVIDPYTQNAITNALVSLSSRSMEEFYRGIDECVRADFHDLSWSFLLALLITTAVVLLGVILEEIVEDVPSTHCACKTSWHKRIAKLGWLLVIAGVLGEGISEGLVYKAEGLIDTFTSTLLGAADKEAKFAEERAAILERENLELKALIQPRDLTVAQQKAIGTAVRQFAGKKVVMTTYTFDQESSAC
jgi:hypothetical protein